MVSITTICESNYFNGVDDFWCLDYNALSAGFEKNTYFYSYMIVPSVWAFVLLFVEASVNLTYYKDCVFALTTFSMFIGMLWFNYDYNRQEKADLIKNLY